MPKTRDGKRLTALLQNLEERRDNKWKKHNVEAEGPKKLKDLKFEEEVVLSPEEKLKAELALLDDKMMKLLKKYVDNDTKPALDELESLSRKYKAEDLIGAYLKYVADDKKDLIPKRMEIFDIILEKHLADKCFVKAWTAAFPNIALLVSEFPFCAAVLAKLLITYHEKREVSLEEFFIKFDEDEQEE